MPTNIAELKAVVWTALEIGIIPTLFIVLFLYFLRHNRDLRSQNDKLIQDLRKMNEQTLEMIRDLVELKVNK
jgi:predicted PurR-regulated permease PerM